MLSLHLSLLLNSAIIRISYQASCENQTFLRKPSNSSNIFWVLPRLRIHLCTYPSLKVMCISLVPVGQLLRQSDARISRLAG